MAEVSLIRCERPRADEGRNLASRNQIELQRRNDGFVRRADRGNECRPVGHPSENVAGRGAVKCHHSVGARHRAGLFAHHIGIGAGRNIDRNHVPRARVQQPDCLGVQSRHRRLETRPQNRVEQQLRIRIPLGLVPALAPRQIAQSRVRPEVLRTSRLHRPAIRPAQPAIRLALLSQPLSVFAPPQNRLRRCCPCRRSRQRAPRTDTEQPQTPRRPNPAFSISVSEGTPKRWLVALSISRISAAVMIFMA